MFFFPDFVGRALLIMYDDMYDTFKNHAPRRVHNQELLVMREPTTRCMKATIRPWNNIAEKSLSRFVACESR